MLQLSESFNYKTEFTNEKIKAQSSYKACVIG
jgi:hypothetical protein